jgi:hypothetical protein
MSSLLQYRLSIIFVTSNKNENQILGERIRETKYLKGYVEFILWFERLSVIT